MRLSLSRRVFVAGAVAAGFAQLATAEQSAEAATTIGFLSERSLPSSYIDKILRGAQAGDLPVEEALTLEVVINFKATNALGLVIPASLRQRAEIVDR